MEISESVVSKLGSFLAEQQEAAVVKILAERLRLPAAQAYDVYFNSSIPKLIEDDEYGVQYLSPEYLAEEIIAKLR